MTQNEAFITDILENPEDDTARLVYADWLDEQGDAARAEFIRTQIELVRLPADDDRRAELTAAERRLYVAHSADWAGDLRMVFRCIRGFIEQLRFADPRRFLEWGPAAFEKHPVRDVEFHTQDRAGWGPDLAACPLLARLRTLRMPGGRSHSHAAADLTAVALSPLLGDLEALDVGHGNRINDDSFARIIGSGARRRRRPAFRALRRLGAAESHLSDAAIDALLDSPLAETLTHLDLGRNEAITAAGLQRLWESPLWARLEEADSGWISLDTAPDYEALATALAGSRLRRLNIGLLAARTETTAQLVRALKKAPAWGSLQALRLSHLKLGGRPFQELVSCPQFANITRLDVQYCGLKTEDLAALAASPHACNLRALSLDYGQTVTDDGIKALAASPHVTGLRYLNLEGTGVTDEGVAAFVGSPNAAHLQYLNLFNVGTDRALQAVADSPHMGRLTTIWVYFAGASDEGLAAVARSPHLRNLTFMDIRRMSMSDATRVALLEAEHIAWPGVSMYPAHHGITDAQRERLQARFGRCIGFGLRTDVPFFSWDLGLT